jgi:rsbT co-antagonist protein RsbR
MDKVINAVSQKQPRFLIVDITSVLVIDTSSADYLMKITRAASLLGTKCLLTGIQPETARTIVDLDLSLHSVDVHSTLREALQACLRKMREI